MAEIFKIVIADTSYEAQLKAKDLYGDDFEIVNTETVKESKFAGIVKHEKVKLTIRIKDNKNNENNYSTIEHTPQKTNYKPVTRVSVPSHDAKKWYMTNQSEMRTNVDGIHGIQEEDEEPKSEKNTNDYSTLARTLFDSLKDIQHQRKKEIQIAGESKTNTLMSKKLDDIQIQVDKLTATISQLAMSSTAFLQENHLPQGLNDIEKELQEIETPQEIIKDIFKSLRKSCDSRTLNESKETFKALHNLIKTELPICPHYEIKKSSKPQIIVLMGPTGVGKTTTIAKLAAQFCFNPYKPVKVSFFNIDFYKLGAKEQLQKYADIFNIVLEDIPTIKQLDECLAKHQQDDLIIVDTAGRSQYAFDDLDELKTYINRLPNATKYLTMSSTSKYSDLKEIVSSFGHIGFDHIILTKTDETKTIGPAVGILLKSNKPLAYITNGQSVPEDYRVADFDFFEKKLFHGFQQINNQKQIYK